MNLMCNFSERWEKIGLGLGFLLSELNQISNNVTLLSSGPVSFLQKLLSQWVQWPTDSHRAKPTLQALCETLRTSYVGLGGLAEKVEKELKYSVNGKGVLAA